MVGGATSGGDRIIGGDVGVRLNDVDLIKGNTKLFRDDLPHHGFRTLSHLDGAAEHIDGSIGIHHDDGSRDRRREHRFDTRRYSLAAALGASWRDSRFRPLDGF